MKSEHALINLISSMLVFILFTTLYALFKGEWLVTILGMSILSVIVLNYKLLLIPIDDLRDRVAPLERKVAELEERLAEYE